MGVESDTEMCNLALSAIGHGSPLVDLTTDQTNEGDECRIHYQQTRRAALRSHPYNFAMKRAWLSDTSTTPAFEFARTFALPNNPYCLKVVRSEAEARGCSVKYRVEGRTIVTNEATFGIEFIADITDVSQWDDLFVDAFKYRLAAALAVPIADSPKIGSNMMGMYQSIVDDAFVIDSQEGTPREVVSLDPWVSARF